ncbi:MAG: 30S ribosomal protein S3 [bacterium]
MGQKVNPKSYRLSLTKDWQAKWFATKNYKNYLAEDDKIRNIIKKQLPKATVSKTNITRNNQDVVIDIYTSRPGIVIGRSGEGTNKLKTLIDKVTSRGKIKLNIFEVKNPETNAQLIAEVIALQVEKRIAFRRAIKQALAKARDKGVKGIKVKISGRLNGVEIARKETFSFGPMPLQTLKSKIDYAKVDALTTYGVIGIKVWIYEGINKAKATKDTE